MSDIKLFESTQIRSVWNEADDKWYFSVADVVQALTDSANVRDYIKKMRRREPELHANWGTLCPPLELLAPDGKRRQTQCANAEGLLRIIQSVPSPKAEPFKSLARPSDNLRDHMTDLELIFTMLGEASTTEIARNREAQGYDENHEAAVEGGTVAGRARRDLERKSGRRVSSKENFKALPEAAVRKRLKKKEG